MRMIRSQRAADTAINRGILHGDRSHRTTYRTRFLQRRINRGLILFKSLWLTVSPRSTWRALPVRPGTLGRVPVCISCSRRRLVLTARRTLLTIATTSGEPRDSARARMNGKRSSIIQREEKLASPATPDVTGLNASALFFPPLWPSSRLLAGKFAEFPTHLQNFNQTDPALAGELTSSSIRPAEDSG